MPPKSRRGPFRPGSGGLPPFLAGRESQQELFDALVEDLADGVPPESEVILYGPRGNGKTTLLVWLHNRIRNTPGVDSIRLTPSDLESPGDLSALLLSKSWWSRLTPAGIAAFGLTWRPRRERPEAPASILAARVRTQPLVVLLDEAHMLDPDVGRALLNAAQTVRADLPLLVVLAGTPDLQDRMATMGASFWNRVEQIPVNRLDPAASADAIRKPLEEEGVAIEPEALTRILEASHGYPFFLQLWGRVVWARRDPARGVTADVVESARPEFERRQGIFYLQRHEELRKRRLLRVGVAVAAAFKDGEGLDADELETAVRRGLPADAAPGMEEDAFVVLRHLGFIWQPRPVPLWEPGIPSLMDYILEHAPSR